MGAARYQRYVAIGDSTSEGMDDPDGRGGYRGWADRLAEKVNAAQGGGLLYANLAIRGRTTRHIREEQLERAVAMRPDLATLSAGMNDLLRATFDAKPIRTDIETMLRALVGDGVPVMIFTLPDMSRVMPLARLFSKRTLALNDAIREACANTGARVLDLAAYEVGTDPRVWSDDRLHANSLGHARIADALAYTLGLPNSGTTWRDSLPGRPPHTFFTMTHAELAWARNHFLPWLWRHAQGKSSGDGRTAKRPELTPV
ncbi:MAG TPA: SGNH/GDSL hydrolase family protein [Thermoanaerobaculia bacterium]